MCLQDALLLRHMRRVVRCAVVAAAALMSFAGAVEACSCLSIDSPPACELYKRPGLVAFVGRAVQVPPNRAAGRVRFRVTQAIKGVAGPDVSVLNEESGAACGHQFQQGEDYVVFASRNADGDIEIARCSDTIWRVHVPDFAYPAFRRRAAEAVAFAESLRIPAVGGRIFGDVSLLVPIPFQAGSEDTKLVDGAKVTLRGSGQVRRAVTAGGLYEFTGLPRGTFSVSVMMPDARTRAESARPAERLLSQHPFPFDYQREYTRRITITDARGCGYAPFEARDNRGRERQPR